MDYTITLTKLARVDSSDATLSDPDLALLGEAHDNRVGAGLFDKATHRAYQADAKTTW